MTKTKSTKRALLTSALSLLLCISMLVGSTFAWFTDSVTSGRNVIQSGNLDVGLEYSVRNANGGFGPYQPVDSATDVFGDRLWEPGHTAVVKFKVTNKGSLALKYQLTADVYDEVPGKNAEGEDIYLSEYLRADVVDMAAPREEILANTNGKKLRSSLPLGEAALAAGDTQEIAFAIWMPTTVGNEANYYGDAVPTIRFGVNLIATQHTVEADAFGTEYDKDASVSTLAEAVALMEAGKDVLLANCREPEAVLTIPADYDKTLTLYNVSLASLQQAPAAATVADESETKTATPAKIVIWGNVVIRATENGMSAISGTALDISGDGYLTAVGKGDHAYGIGGDTTESIFVKGVTIAYVAGGHAGEQGTDTKYYKNAPEGGAAIGSGLDGAVVSLDSVTVNKAVGGSKAAAIGASFHTGVTVNIHNSTIVSAEGGVSAAGIGGSRVSDGATESGNIVNITGSNVTVLGGAYGAGIGSGYDTHCQDVQPLCTVNISDSTIKATGGKYAAGIGTGYHNAALAGEIKNSTITAVSGEKWYKDAYTQAMNIGFGVVDPTREGKQTNSFLLYEGEKLTIPVVE